MYLAKIYEEEYPTGAYVGLIIGAANADDALAIFKIRNPRWESMNYEIVPFP